MSPLINFPGPFKILSNSCSTHPDLVVNPFLFFFASKIKKKWIFSTSTWCPLPDSQFRNRSRESICPVEPQSQAVGPSHRPINHCTNWIMPHSTILDGTPKKIPFQTRFSVRWKRWDRKNPFRGPSFHSQGNLKKKEVPKYFPRMVLEFGLSVILFSGKGRSSNRVQVWYISPDPGRDFVTF